jgi:hypothetical protein
LAVKTLAMDPFCRGGEQTHDTTQINYDENE